MLKKTALFLMIAILSMTVIGEENNSTAPDWARLLKEAYILLDFDSPMRVSGKANPVILDEGGFIEGRFGKGYSFQREGKNQLSADVAAGRSEEAFTTAPKIRKPEESPAIPADKPTVKDNNPKKESFELMDDPRHAKSQQEKIEFADDIENPGEKIITVTGGRLTLKEQPFKINYHYASLNGGLTASVYVKGEAGTELTIEVVATPFAESIEKVMEKYEKEAKANGGKAQSMKPDASFPQKVKLNGNWQRVAAYATMDSRFGYGRKAAFNIISDNGKKLQFRRFQLENTGVYPHMYFAPTRWMPGGKSHAQNMVRLNNPEQLKVFPCKAGTLSMWIKDTTDSNIPINTHDVLSMHKSWQTNWLFNLKNFWVNDKTGYPANIAPPGEWEHVAVTWDENNVTAYKSGIQTASRKRTKIDDDTANMALLIGAANSARTSAELHMDEVALFSRALNADEIAALSKRQTALASESNEYIGTEIENAVFFRNDNDAKCVFNVFAPKTDEVTIKTKMNGVSLQVKKQKMNTGANEVSIPFMPYHYAPGKVVFEAEFTDSKGKKCFSYQRDLKINGRLEPGEFKFFSWGGNAFIPMDYLNMTGVNSVNVDVGNDNYIRELTENGKHLNLRLGNAGEFYKTDFDVQKIAESARKSFGKYRGFHNWTTTLLNTEVYGAGIINNLKENRKWIEWATKELGEAPSFEIVDAPPQVKRPKGWILPANGIIDDDPALKTLVWFMNTGMPPYIVNGITAKVVHELSPSNIVWSEPIMSPGMMANIDMGASWGYEYSEYQVLAGFKCASAAAKAARKLYMPTLGMCYWPTQTGMLEEPKPNESAKKAEEAIGILEGKEEAPAADKAPKKKSVHITPTVDDIVIKSYIAAGAVPAHNISAFSIDSWMLGEKSLENIGKDWNSVKIISDRDSGKIYGETFRKNIYPAAVLLRDMPNRQPDIAILMPSSTEWTAGQWWGHYHYTQAYMSCVSKSGIDFDVIGDEGMTAENLKRYKYLFFPMGVTITKENYAALSEAAKTSTVVVDTFCKQEYPNMVRLELKYNYKDMKNALTDKFSEYLKEIREKLKSDSFAWAEGEKAPVFVFPRTHKGGNYLMLINNARTTGEMNKYKKDEWYTPYGASQKAKISLKIPESSVVYDFMASKQIPFKFIDGRAVIEMEMAPAAGHLLCIYPNAFKDISVSQNGDFSAGKIGTLKISLKDTSGKQPGGRQLVNLEVTDSNGKKRDESGIYTLENGEASIPVRFTLNENPGSWKAEITERTSGLKKMFNFKIK